MDDIFSQLQAVRRNLSDTISNILESVIALRGRGWDQNSSHASSSSQLQNGFTNNYTQGQYLNSHDGFSAEENEYIASVEEFNDLFISDYDPDELCDPEPEMDEEIQAAFKEFVQMSKR